jgi:hypothetical protein
MRSEPDFPPSAFKTVISGAGCISRFSQWRSSAPSGFTTGLLITDESAAEVRPTIDVDVIAEITTYTGYAAFSERLRALGFREDSGKGAPLCCWLIDAIKLDVMALEEEILGFTNRWYRAAMEAAQEINWK